MRRAFELGTRFLTLLGGLALACAVAAESSKVVADAAPVRDLTVMLWTAEIPATPDGKRLDWGASSPQFKEALRGRLLEVFAWNALPVQGFGMNESFPRADAQLQALLLHSKSSHVLLLRPVAYAAFTRRGQIYMPPTVTLEARLWEMAGKRFVWVARETLVLVAHQPRQSVQYFAGKLLNAMHADGMAALKSGRALDGSSEPIEEYSTTLDDR